MQCTIEELGSLLDYSLYSCPTLSTTSWKAVLRLLFFLSFPVAILIPFAIYVLWQCGLLVLPSVSSPLYSMRKSEPSAEKSMNGGKKGHKNDWRKELTAWAKAEKKCTTSLSPESAMEGGKEGRATGPGSISNPTVVLDVETQAQKGKEGEDENTRASQSGGLPRAFPSFSLSANDGGEEEHYAVSPPRQAPPLSSSQEGMEAEDARKSAAQGAGEDNRSPSPISPAAYAPLSLRHSGTPHAVDSDHQDGDDGTTEKPLPSRDSQPRTMIEEEDGQSPHGTSYYGMEKSEAAVRFPTSPFFACSSSDDDEDHRHGEHADGPGSFSLHHHRYRMVGSGTMSKKKKKSSKAPKSGSSSGKASPSRSATLSLSEVGLDQTKAYRTIPRLQFPVSLSPSHGSALPTATTSPDTLLHDVLPTQKDGEEEAAGWTSQGAEGEEGGAVQGSESPVRGTTSSAHPGLSPPLLVSSFLSPLRHSSPPSSVAGTRMHSARASPLHGVENEVEEDDEEEEEDDEEDEEEDEDEAQAQLKEELAEFAGSVQAVLDAQQKEIQELRSSVQHMLLGILNTMQTLRMLDAPTPDITPRGTE